MGRDVSSLQVFIRCRGDRGSRERLFDDIWVRYQKRLAFFIRNMVKTDGEDLLQEVMEKVFRNIERYNPIFSFNTWIYSIARNHCLNHMAKRVLPLAGGGGEEEVEPPAGTNNSPEEQVLGKELRNKIDKILDTFSEENRQIAFFRFYEGMKHREIARILNIPTGTAKSRVHAIRTALRMALEEYDETR